MTTITSPHGTTTPELVTEYETNREGRTLAHTLMNGGVAVVHRPTGLRALTLVMLYGADEADAAACETLHAKGGLLTLTEPTRPTVSMTYVVTGAIRRQLDTEFNVWNVTAEIQEVA